VLLLFFYGVWGQAHVSLMNFSLFRIRFPLCPKKRQIWLNRCRLTNAEISPNCKICSFHFEPTCFKSGVKRRILYPDAVPTIFKKDRFEMANTPLKNTKGIIYHIFLPIIIVNELTSTTNGIFAPMMNFHYWAQ